MFAPQFLYVCCYYFSIKYILQINNASCFYPTNLQLISWWSDGNTITHKDYYIHMPWYLHATMFKVQKKNHGYIIRRLSIKHLSIIRLTSSSSSGGRRSTSLLFSSSSSSSSSRHTTAEPNVPMDLQYKSTRVLTDPGSAGASASPRDARSRRDASQMREFCTFSCTADKERGFSVSSADNNRWQHGSLLTMLSW